MELLLVRHALPVRTEFADGVADPPLAPDGIQQALRLAEYLDSETFHAIYSSPQRRAMETARPLAERRGLDIVQVPDVAEWDQGSSSYVPIEEVKAEGGPEWEALRNGLIAQAAEPPAEFSRRVVTAIEGLIDRHGGERIVVLCHGMVINFFLANVLGLPAEAAFFSPNYTSIHRVAAARSGERSIVTINETAHLRGSGLPIGLFQR
ncbi:MAG: histidine phosphatase family protein [Ilumatobacteraceae bacterium]